MAINYNSSLDEVNATILRKGTKFNKDYFNFLLPISSESCRCIPHLVKQSDPFLPFISIDNIQGRRERNKDNINKLKPYIQKNRSKGV